MTYIHNENDIFVKNENKYVRFFSLFTFSLVHFSSVSLYFRTFNRSAYCTRTMAAVGVNFVSILSGTRQIIVREFLNTSMSFLTEEACWPTLLAKRGNWFRMYRWHFRSSTFIAWRPPRCFSSLPIFKFLFFFILIFYSRFSNFASIILYFHSVISLIFYILRLIHIGSFIICKTLWLLKYASNMH